MISIKSFESVFDMLSLLDSRVPVEGTGIIKIDDMVHVVTPTGNIPIYMFKMNRNLQNLLHEHYDIWNS